MSREVPRSARPRGVSAPRALLIAVACGLFAAASMLLARVDGTHFVRPMPDSSAGSPPLDDSIAPGARPGDVLRAQPANGAAIRQMADAAEARGDHARAQRLYAIAVRRNRRDVPAQLRLVDAALARHDAAAALPHLDAALRVAPDVAEPAMRRLLASLGDPTIRAALAAQLAGDPPWRGLLATLLPTADPVAAQALLSELSSRPLPPAELALRVSLLESLGRAPEARAAWRAALPANARPLDARLFDGGFEYGEGPQPYGWRLPSAPEALVGLDTAHVAQGRSALSILMQGRAVILPDVSQRIVLAPGDYVLALQADSALTGSGRGFAWVVSCNAPDLELARLALPRQTRGWQRFTIDFVVPPNCATQTLRLVQEGRNLDERLLSGRLGVDAMQILPGPG